MSEYGNVEYLDSIKLTEAANTLNKNLEIFKNQMMTINNQTNALIITWKGKGCEEFEKDFYTVYQQLSDISEIMYELYSSLVDANATYIQTDEELGKKMNMEG